MNIVIVHNHTIPVHGYGGVERIIWWLGKELKRLGHTITYLVPPPSECPFAGVIAYDPAKTLKEQIPPDTEFVHLCFQSDEKPTKPYLMMYQYNHHPHDTFDINTVFVSKDHAARHQAKTYVYNSIDIEEYGDPSLGAARDRLLFLGYAKRPEKNLADCLRIARKTGNVLAIVGGKDKWYKRRPWAEYMGFLGGEAKMQALRRSKALLFPVLWHEPFGIVIIESLYFGSPVIGSAYGSLQELIGNDYGCATNSVSQMIDAVKNLDSFDKKKCHEYVCELFNAKVMTQNYLRLYEKVLAGQTLNEQEPVNNGNFSRDELLPLTR